METVDIIEVEGTSTSGDLNSKNLSLENQRVPHVSDGVTYMRPRIYKCKNCGKRLTSDDFKNTDCVKE